MFYDDSKILVEITCPIRECPGCENRKKGRKTRRSPVAPRRCNSPILRYSSASIVEQINENKAAGVEARGRGETRRKKKRRKRTGTATVNRRFERSTLMDVSCRSLRNRRERSREYSSGRDTVRSTARQSDDDEDPRR